METALTSLFALVVMLVGVTTTFAASDNAMNGAAESLREMTAHSEERLSTRVEVTGVTVDGSGQLLTVTAMNIGQRMITAFNRIDVIVEYRDESGTSVLQSLTYTDGAAAPGQWAALSISDDAFNPRLLDPGESLVISAHLPSVMAAGVPGNLTVVAPPAAVTGARFERE